MKVPEITQGLKLTVVWYDQVPEPQRNQAYQGEVVGWRDTQIIVRVKDYAVLRFWKRNGLEVCNADYRRRGFRLDLSELTPAPKSPPGVAVDLSSVQADGT